MRQARGAVRGPDSPARVVVRRRRLRRPRHHHAAAPQGSDHQGTVEDDRDFRDLEPPEDLQLPADRFGRRASLRAADRRAPRRRGVPASADRRRDRSPDAVLREGRGERRIRGRHPRRRSRRSSRARYFIFRLEKEPEGARPGETYRVADVDLASRLSFFLWGALPDQELLTLAEPEQAVGAGDAREAGAPDAGRSARRGARHEVRRAVAAAAGRREGPSGSELLSRLRRQPCRRDAPRDRAVLQPPRARGPQPARAVFARTTPS